MYFGVRQLQQARNVIASIDPGASAATSRGVAAFASLVRCLLIPRRPHFRLAVIEAGGREPWENQSAGLRYPRIVALLGRLHC
jgi:hypothetical protein